MLKVILLDASGSMEPAWDAAWSLIFEQVRRASFVLLAFKARAVDSIPQKCVRHYANAVVYDLGCVLAERGLTRLKRKPSPSDVGICFSTRTPLNDALIYTISAIDKRGVPFEIVVVSDNRDTASERTMDDVLIAKARAHNLKRIVLHCVGSCLQKYLDPYDKVEVVGQPIPASPSPFL